MTAAQQQDDRSKKQQRQQLRTFQLPQVDGTLPSEALGVNAVEPLEDVDYQYAKKLCDDHSNWELAFERKSTRIWTRLLDGSPFHMIKARAEFKDVPVHVCYDVLQDAEYRYKWDKYVLRNEQIGYLNPNNDICYYAVGALPPFRNRDFVLLRSWLDLGQEKLILAHSVWHNKFPPNSAKYVRGIVYLTIYFVRGLGHGKGCQVTYLTLADPKGKLPSWLINRLTKTIAPKLIKKLHKACLNYERWERKNLRNERHKTWLMGTEAICSKLDLTECIPPANGGKVGGADNEEEELDESGVAAIQAWNNDDIDDADDDANSVLMGKAGGQAEGGGEGMKMGEEGRRRTTTTKQRKN